MQTDRFEQLRAAVGGDGRDPHLGHDLIQTFVDTVAIVQHHRTVRFIDGFAVDQLRQRFVGEVWIDSRRPKAEQHGEVVRIAGAGGFNDDVGIAAQALSTRRVWIAPTAIGAGTGRRSLAMLRSESTSSTVPSRTICSALSHSAFTVSLREASAGLNVISRTSAR